MPECRIDTKTRNLAVGALALALDHLSECSSECSWECSSECSSECSWECSSECSSDFASGTACGDDDRGGGDSDGDGGNGGGGGNGGDSGSDGGGEPDGGDAKTWTRPAHLAGFRWLAPSSGLVHLHLVPLQAWRPGAAPALSSHLVHLRCSQNPLAPPRRHLPRMVHTCRKCSCMSISLTMPC